MRLRGSIHLYHDDGTLFRRIRYRGRDLRLRGFVPFPALAPIFRGRFAARMRALRQDRTGDASYFLTAPPVPVSIHSNPGQAATQSNWGRQPPITA